MKKVFLITLFFITSLFLPAEIVNGNAEFYLELTKLGESTFGFCSSDSALYKEPIGLLNGINFPLWDSAVAITSGLTAPPRTSFGVYWDLYSESDVNISMNVSFSADESGIYDYMLVNKDSSDSVLNFSATGKIFENREGAGVELDDEIDVPIQLINTRPFTDRTIDIFSKDVKAFDRIYGSAIFDLVLNFPYEGNSQINFQGGEYSGYAILTLNVI